MASTIANCAYKSFIGFVSRSSRARTALLVGAAAVGVIYLKNQLFPNKHVSFGEDRVKEIEENKKETFPQGYFVQHPARGPCIAILEKITSQDVIFRFQDEKETVEPHDYIFLSREEFLSWSPEKIW